MVLTDEDKRNLTALVYRKKRKNRQVRRLFKKILKTYGQDVPVETEMIDIIAGCPYEERKKLAAKLRKETFRKDYLAVSSPKPQPLRQTEYALANC